MSGRRRRLGATLGVVATCALLPMAAAAGEPDGFRGRPWGTPWDERAIAALPGCAGQGELVTDVGGYIARVAQPECVGYHVSERLRGNLILLYPDVKWHALEHAEAVVDHLLRHRRMWALSPETVAALERAAAAHAGLARRRPLLGVDRPVFSDLAEHLDLPQPARGLQGYQINFPAAQYPAMRAALTAELGPPTVLAHDPTGGETLEWSGQRARALLKERGGAGASGYFAVVTTSYLRIRAAELGRTRATAVLPPSVISYPWLLQVVEWFEWALGGAPPSAPRPPP